MITVYQNDILTLLKDFKCLRGSHIKKYMAAKHNSTDEQLTKMLTQLIFLGKIRRDGSFIMLPGRKTNPEVIRAFDVVMDVTHGYVDSIYSASEPFTIMFSVRADAEATSYNKFGVAAAKPCFESSLCERLSSADSTLTVIFVLESIEQQKLLKIENKHYFAIKGENDKYDFYKAVDKPKFKEV